MDKRKEMKEAFNPEKINFVAVIDSINWCREVTPVDLVRVVNNVEGLRGRKRYETNEKSFGLLIKCFEKIVGDFVTTRINGKDRFYTLKPEYKPEQLVGYARTGKIPEIKEELKREDSKYYIPDVPESGEKPKIGGRGKKRSFPDNEALVKTVIIMGMCKNGNGEFKSAEYNKAVEEFGWKRQRSVEGKLSTNFQEANKVTSWLDLGELFVVKTSRIELIDPKKNLSILEGKISEVAALIDDEDLKGKALGIIKPKVTVEEKVEPKIEEKPKPEIRSIEQPFKEPKKTPERPRIFKASPEVGKSEFRETGSAPSMIYEGSKTRWYKSLIGGTLKGAERGVWYNFSDISQIIKKTRFVEISCREIKDLCGEISKQWKGIFREVDFGGITVGSETLVKQFIEAYPAEKITESIFLRLHMSIDELEETYPELKIKVASEIGENDNIVEIEMNRAEKTEKAFAKLVFRMRQGEIILESPSNWTIKRSKILIDKLFGGM